MLTCVDKKRDGSGDIVEYLFSDGTRLRAFELKKKLRKNEIVISNLKLSADGRVVQRSQKEQKALLGGAGEAVGVAGMRQQVKIPVKNQIEKDGKKKKTLDERILELLNKSFRLSQDEFRALTVYIMQKLDLSFKLLGIITKRKDSCSAFYSVGPFTLYMTWESKDMTYYLDKAKSNKYNKYSKEFAESKEHSYWKIVIFDGLMDRKHIKVSYTNAEYLYKDTIDRSIGAMITLVDGKQKIFVGYEKVYNEEDVGKKLESIAKDAALAFNPYVVIGEINTKLKERYRDRYKVSTNYTMEFGLNSNYVVCDVLVETPKKTEVLRLNITNYDYSKKLDGEYYKLDVFVLGIPIKLSVTTLDEAGIEVNTYVEKLIKSIDSSILQLLTEKAKTDDKFLQFILQIVFQDKGMLTAALDNLGVEY